MRRILLVATWFALLLQAQANDLQTDPRLHKTVNLQLPDALLEEVTAELSKQTGVPLTVDRTLNEEKATLFVKDKPAWQVLEKLTALLDIRCEKNGGGYHLSADPVAIRKEQDTLQWEQVALRREVERMLREWSQATHQDYLAIVAKLRAMEEEAKQLEKEKPLGWQERRDALGRKIYPLQQVSRVHCYLAGWCYQRLPASAWKPFWDGEVLWFSTPGNLNALPLPADALRWVSLLSPEAEFVQFGVQLDRHQERLVFYLRTRDILGGDSSVCEEPIRPDAFLYVPLHLRWSQWCTPEETLARAPQLQERLHRSRAISTRHSAATMADWLQRWAQYSGSNVIADSFRLPQPLIEQGDTLIEWLRDSPMWDGGYLRVEGEWLLFRHRSYWRLKRSELPERLVREIERKARQEGLSLEDYATLASYLTPEGIARLAWPVHDYAFHFDHTPLKSASPALRFWASLTDNQKKLALQRQPLPYVSLTPAQQKLFREALLVKLYEQPKLVLLDVLNNPEAQTELAFVVDRWREDAYTLEGDRVSITAESPEELEQQRHLILDAPDKQQQAQIEQITFTFGIDSWRSVRYDFSIRNKFALFSHPKQEKEGSSSKILPEK
ncbi:MAG: hypothetical protein KatS3mg022_0237 [Armatimonadota bacterium]|nr:MAG: hypothetical protein KatS3mg022_0237 [Armatimonadota bacterium]